jgi:hypothetical protein
MFCFILNKAKNILCMAKQLLKAELGGTYSYHSPTNYETLPPTHSRIFFQDAAWLKRCFV